MACARNRDPTDYSRIMGILKHGAEVKVLEPPFLQDLLKQEIEKMKKIIATSRNDIAAMDNKNMRKLLVNIIYGTTH